jgi:RimJ/RimL family protein N-acetyltransferase
VIYLSIFSKAIKLAGYCVLEKEHNINEIRLKRIRVDQNYLGIGQEAILEVERYCLRCFNTRRLWLDIFKTIIKARHVYKKLG